MGEDESVLFEILICCEMELEMCFPVGGGGWVRTVAGAEAEALRSGWRRLRAPSGLGTEKPTLEAIT